MERYVVTHTTTKRDALASSESRLEGEENERNRKLEKIDKVETFQIPNCRKAAKLSRSS